MADPTPPSDLPDPASSNPAPGPGAGATGPKRIRSMPTRERSTSMRPATYSTGGKTDDANWRRGLTVLWTLFILTALAEALNAAFHLLAGYDVWPLPEDAGRLALVCSLVVGLYVGWNGLRFLLAAVDLVAGGWLLINVIASYQTAPLPKGSNLAYAPPAFSVIESYPKLALAVLYLVTALYLVLSSDVLGFVRHRRAAGRTWPAGLVAVGLFAFLIAVFAAQSVYTGWLRGKLPEAQSAGYENLQSLAQHWDAAYYTEHAEPESLKDWSEGARTSTFSGLSSLGALQSAEPAAAITITGKDLSPLQNVAPMAGNPITGVSKDGHGFMLGYRYFTKEAVFAHGKGQFGFDMVRGLSGPWQLAKFNAVNVQTDRPPAPPAPPVPAVDPAAPSPAASPADPAAPAAPASPAPAASLAPLPAGTATPAASPVPPTGG